MIAANINQPRPRVALLGAGTMGSGMAQRLLELGFSVDGWNRTPGPAAQLAEHGAIAYADAARAADSVDALSHDAAR